MSDVDDQSKPEAAQQETTPPTPAAPVGGPEPVRPEEGEGDGNGSPTAAKDSGDERLREMMSANFIEYASYVIKERAIPDVDDGLKPVQRRILHSLQQMDDGRFHKVANVIGHTMQYHPHGDASIGAALVVLANKEYFIERQGNFGNIYTGDQASAARYIECRLTPLAREILFNKEITEFEDSYDGRNLEPIRLPAKIPSLLMLGTEGIAVGMTSRVLPHNFNELLDAQVAILKGKDFTVYPDFLTGGVMDVGDYDDGRGRVKVRAKIEIRDDKTLVIREIPASTTTESLTASIEDAARRGKIKVAGISDFTGENVEIEIRLPRGAHAKEMVNLLYAQTDCEASISTSPTVICDGSPVIMGVSEVLRRNTDRLVEYLRRELEIELGKLGERFHEKTLVQIFIENRIYKRIEECTTYDKVLAAVREGLAPFLDQLRRELRDDDIEKLLQIQIRRISRFDIDKNRSEIEDILAAMQRCQADLADLTGFSIRYLQAIKEKYGKDYPRRTQIADIEDINVRRFALQNLRVGHDRSGHFVGYEVRNSNKSEDPIQCSEYDRLVLLQSDGVYKVIPVPDKLYVGPVKYVFKADKEQVYSIIYRDRKRKVYFAKRFRIDRYIMDKEYKALPKNCIIESIYTNYGVVVRCQLAPGKRSAEDHVDVVFDEVEMRSARARGFKITDRKVTGMTQVRRGTPEPPPDAEEAPAPPPPKAAPTGAVKVPKVKQPTEPDVLTVDAVPKKSTESTEPAEPVEPAVEPVDPPQEAEPPAEPPTPPKKPTPKRKPKKQSASKPAERDDQLTSRRRVAEEWRRRSTRAVQGAGADERPDTSSAQPIASGAPETPPKPPTEPDDPEPPPPAPQGAPAPAKPPPTARRKGRRRIDEDTPFFLE